MTSGARLPAISRYNDAIELIARRMRAKCLIVVSNLFVVTWVGIALDEDWGKVPLEFSHCESPALDPPELACDGAEVAGGIEATRKMYLVTHLKG